MATGVRGSRLFVRFMVVHLAAEQSDRIIERCVWKWYGGNRTNWSSWLKDNDDQQANGFKNKPTSIQSILFGHVISPYTLHRPYR